MHGNVLTCMDDSPLVRRLMDSQKKLTQKKLVYEYMKTHDGITDMDAYRDLQITRLSGRIYDLRKEFVIASDWERNEETRKRYVRYRLIKEEGHPDCSGNFNHGCPTR